MPLASPAAPDPAPARPAAPAEWTHRALGTGLAVGMLLCVGNVYMGLKTGWWDSGHVTASILAFALAAALPRRGGARFTTLENNLAQSAAAAAAAAPAAFNLLAGVPALSLLGRAPPAWAVAGLGLALAVLGVLLALALRARLLEEERLPFPSGVAAAEVIGALHAGRGASRPARALAATGAASAAFTLLRDLTGRVPQSTSLPLRLLGQPASALTLGISWNPLLLGAGMMVGLRNGLSVALGAAVAWGILAPRLVASGAVASSGYRALVGWLTWPGVGVVLGAAAVSILAQGGAFAAALRDLRGIGAAARARDRRAALALAATGAVAAAGFAGAAFGMRPGVAAAGVALGLLLATVSVRAAGQTDILPAGEMAQIAQVALGGGGAAPASLGAAALAAGPSAQAGAALWSFRAGHRLGAAARLQAGAMLAGALLGGAVAMPAYEVLVRAYGVGTAALPAPSAAPWRAVGELVTGGGARLPPGALAAAVIGFAAGAALQAVRGRRGVPSPGAVGMGFIAPAHYAAAICAGALVGAAWRRLGPSSADELGAAAASGAIAGESLAGAAAAALLASGIAPRP